MPRGNDSSKKPDPWPHLLVMIFFEVTFIWMPAILLFIFAVSLPEVHFNFRAAAILVIKRLVIDTSHPAVWASASMDWVVSAQYPKTPGSHRSIPVPDFLPDHIRSGAGVSLWPSRDPSGFQEKGGNIRLTSVLSHF